MEMDINTLYRFFVIKNKPWKVVMSMDSSWVVVENDRYEVFCFSSGNIEVLDKKTEVKTRFRCEEKIKCE